MSRRPARVTQADIRRALKAAEKAGVARAVEIAPDGTIRLVPIPPQADKPAPVPDDEVIVL